VQLVDAINKLGTEAVFFETIQAATLYVKETVIDGDIVVVMGAGPVTEVATLLTN
jgi:UDP-N-acetylmuramate-alanine ligase